MASAASTIDTSYDIVTPENIEFEYQVAGPLRRAPAFVLDLFLRVATMYALLWIIDRLVTMTGSADIEVFGITFIFIMWFLLEWTYGGLFETFWNGQTPGKWMLGLRVLTTHGEPINGMQAMLRNILRLVDSMPILPVIAFITVFGIDPHNPPDPIMDTPGFVWFLLCFVVYQFFQFTYLVGLITPAFNSKRQRVGDLVAGTMVIVEEKNWLYGMVRLDDARVRNMAAQLPAHLDVGRSTAKALATYAERRRFFSPARRQEIAMHLGHTLIERYHLPPVSDHDLLLCAIYYKVFFTEDLDEPAADNPYVNQEEDIRLGPLTQRRG